MGRSEMTESGQMAPEPPETTPVRGAEEEIAPEGSSSTPAAEPTTGDDADGGEQGRTAGQV
jgi:hypothetical protein